MPRTTRNTPTTRRRPPLVVLGNAHVGHSTSDRVADPARRRIWARWRICGGPRGMCVVGDDGGRYVGYVLVADGCDPHARSNRTTLMTMVVRCRHSRVRGAMASSNVLVPRMLDANANGARLRRSSRVAPRNTGRVASIRESRHPWIACARCTRVAMSTTCTRS